MATPQTSVCPFHPPLSTPNSCTARTYPANGVFTEPQRDLYAAVLAAQKACVSLCTEAAGFSLNTLHRKSVDLLRVELNQIGFGLVSGDLERVLYPHFLSHPIGIGTGCEISFARLRFSFFVFADLHESSNFDRGQR